LIRTNVNYTQLCVNMDLVPTLKEVMNARVTKDSNKLLTNVDVLILTNVKTQALSVEYLEHVETQLVLLSVLVMMDSNWKLITFVEILMNVQRARRNVSEVFVSTRLAPSSVTVRKVTWPVLTVKNASIYDKDIVTRPNSKDNVNLPIK